jgi:hypothetical protein
VCGGCGGDCEVRATKVRTTYAVGTDGFPADHSKTIRSKGRGITKDSVYCSYTAGIRIQVYSDRGIKHRTAYGERLPRRGGWRCNDWTNHRGKGLHINE